MPPFSLLSPRDLRIGRGTARAAIPDLSAMGRRLLLVHGAAPDRAAWLVDALRAEGRDVGTVATPGEPDLPTLDAARHAAGPIDAVIALGGGAAIDHGKALSALLPNDGPTRDYLEVVGTGRALERPPLPFAALSTTAGTGSEVTKNAVVTVPDRALKVSLRDPRMVPALAISDPDLMRGAPRQVVLAAALDALTQVIEPFCSTKANPMTDALCRAAIPATLSALRPLVEADDAAAWDAMAWVAPAGGLALANAGLGAVHGLAGVIGGATGAPHGAICGRLLLPVLAANRAALPGNDRLDWVAGRIDVAFGPGGLTPWIDAMGLPGLGGMGLRPERHAAVAEAARNASSMRGNPVPLSTHALVDVLEVASGP